MFLPPSPIDSAILILRSRYDPLVDHIGPHVTLVHPFSDTIDVDNLRQVVQTCAVTTKPIRVALDQVTPFPDGHLYLNVKAGNDAIIDLRDRLYDGPLAQHRSRWDTFVPHVTVGRYDNRATMRAAIDDAMALDLKTTLTLMTITAYRFDEHERRLIEFAVQFGS